MCTLVARIKARPLVRRGDASHELTRCATGTSVKSSVEIEGVQGSRRGKVSGG